MKRFFLFLIMALGTQLVHSQTWCDFQFTLNFDDTICLHRLSIDTVNYPNNRWQIGFHNKSTLDSTACKTKVIVTDTLNPYPVNDTSVFTLKFRLSNGIAYGCKMLEGDYYVQTDSLNDYGKIEFSPNNGTTWVDFINDTAYSSMISYIGDIPVFTGRSIKCKHFNLAICDIGSVFNVQSNDTLLFRFTFISDSIYDNLGGLMFDNLEQWDFVEGISKTRFKPIKSIIYPNPSADFFTIDFENATDAVFELSVYDMNSKLVFKDEEVRGKRYKLDAQLFIPGVYMYKLTQLQSHERSWCGLLKPPAAHISQNSFSLNTELQRLELNLQFVELFLLYTRRGIDHHISSGIIFRKGNKVAYAVLSAKDSAPTVESKGDTTVRGSSEFKGVHQKSKLILRLFG